MTDYYSNKLSANKLQRCYEIASPRVQQYFEAELNHVLEKIHSHDLVLDLGCGYGRIIPALAQKARQVFGIDTSIPSLLLGLEFLREIPRCFLQKMDASHLTFDDKVFDKVICIQNGISAFHVDQRQLIRESLRVTKSGGTVLFSSYSEKFWQYRLEWFERQAEAGLIGEIDYEKTGNGIIVCNDGFTATTVSPERFIELTSGLNVNTNIVEVDESCIFCEMRVR